MKATAWMLTASTALLAMLSLPVEASAHHNVATRHVWDYPVPAPDRLLLSWDRTDVYGGDVTMFFETGSWWCFVDDLLYRAQFDRGDWLLVRAYTLPQVAYTWTRPLQRACYAGDRDSCRQWRRHVRQRMSRRSHYWQTQRFAWRQAEIAQRQYRRHRRYNARWQGRRSLHRGMHREARSESRREARRERRREARREARHEAREERRENRRQDRREQNSDRSDRRSRRGHSEGQRHARR